MPLVTSVPEVVDSLVALARRALPGVQVLDGDEPAEVDPDTLVIGLGSEGDGVAGYTVTITQQPGMGQRPQEDWTVRCWLSSWSGDTAMKPRRDRAAEMLAAIDLALRGDVTLGGACSRVQLGKDAQWVPVHSADGSACGVAFEVTGTTLL